MKTREFDKLKPLNLEASINSYIIYRFSQRDDSDNDKKIIKEFYFKNPTDALYYFLRINNFKNIFIEYPSYEYRIFDKTFYNKSDYENFILGNLKEGETNNYKKILYMLSSSTLLINLAVSNEYLSKTLIHFPKIISSEPKEDEKDQEDEKNKPNKQISDKDMLLNSIREDIKQNSQFFRADNLYTYKPGTNKNTDKKFNSKKEIIENGFLKDNPIETFRTPVNPLSLDAIKDTEHALLNEKMARYGFNLDDYLKVFRTQTGNFVIANGKVGTKYKVPEYFQNPKTINEYQAEKFALNSYINPGLLRPKYSYTGYDNDWHDSALEAKELYENKETEKAEKSGEIKKHYFIIIMVFHIMLSLKKTWID